MRRNTALQIVNSEILEVKSTVKLQKDTVKLEENFYEQIDGYSLVQQSD